MKTWHMEFELNSQDEIRECLPMDIIVTSQQSDPDNSKQVNQKGKSSMAHESNRTD